MNLEVSVSLKNVRMNYGSGDVLKGLDLELNSGRIVALLGINGAGKSTLMQILSGVLKPTAGEFSTLGKVAMVYQELSLFPDLSIAENILLPRLNDYRRFGLVDWPAMNKAARTSLNRVGLDVDPTQPASSLTTGEAQLTEIARALDLNPSILVLDEPTSALSRKECDRLFALLKTLVSTTQCTVLFVSHRLDEVKEIADDVVILKDGLISGMLRGEEIEASRIVELMTGISPEQSKSHTQSGEVKKVVLTNSAHALLSIDGFSVTEKSSKKVLAESNGRFHIPPKTCIGIAGLMGSGRSVFLRGLAANLKLASGGVSPTLGDLNSQGTVTGSAIGYLHEDRKAAGLFAELSAVENIAIAEKQNGYARARKLFSQLKVRGDANAAARTLSGGNQQKLLFGRAILSGAKVLLLDEPTRGVDAHARLEIYRMMDEFTESGGAIIWVSSDFDELVAHSDAILSISRGQIASVPLYPNSGTELTAQILDMETLKSCSTMH